MCEVELAFVRTDEELFSKVHESGLWVTWAENCRKLYSPRYLECDLVALGRYISMAQCISGSKCCNVPRAGSLVV